MNPFSLLIKPAGADCNLRCRYCFYLGKQALYPGGARRMSEAVLTMLVRRTLALPFPMQTFAWQGGEPLLMGVEFFRKAVALQRRYARPGVQVVNCLQTNGTLIDAEWAAFFAQEKFLIGVSVDGPEAVHNEGRGAGHAAVMRGLEHLKAAGVEHNILTLVSQSNVRDPAGVYRYLRDDLGERYLQFIECVEFDAEGKLLPYAITPEEWADFVCGIFDEWIQGDTQTVSVRLFDSVVSKLLTGNANSCAMGCDCRSYFVVEHTGDVYPCDFYVNPETQLGNIVTDDWDELWEHPKHTAFGARKLTRHAACETCPYVMYCQGDCPKNRVGHSVAADPRTLSYLCPAWQKIYAHILPGLTELAGKVAQRRS